MNDRRKWAFDAWQRTKYRCMGCARKRQPMEIHEMERRSHSGKRWAHRCNYLLICRDCHSGAFATMTHAKQLAFKLFWDPEHFDLQAWLRLRDRDLVAPERVTLAEVEAALVQVRQLFDGVKA